MGHLPHRQRERHGDHCTLALRERRDARDERYELGGEPIERRQRRTTRRLTQLLLGRAGWIDSVDEARLRGDGRDVGVALTHQGHQEFIGVAASPTMFGTTGWPEDEFQEKDLPVANAYLSKNPTKSWDDARQHAIDMRRGKKTA